MRDDLQSLVQDIQSIRSPVRTFLNELYRRYLPVRDGAIADYIPELAKADPDSFGISLVTVNGRSFDAGDFQRRFTVQSISKPLVYGLALEDWGREHVMRRVGVEPTGEAFNSIVLDEESNRPYNPMVNAGAIATAGLVKGADPAERVNRMLAMFRRYTGKDALVDAAVFTSERSTGHRNRAIGHLMLNFGMVDANVEEILDLYFQQCSVLVTSHDLAVMAATLANGGLNPVTGERALDAQYVRDLLSVMYTCGMYNFAGEWCHAIGVPAKSGVSGGVMAVAPGRLGVGIYSPALDARGNSVRGIAVCRELSEQLGLHVFSPASERTPLARALEQTPAA